MARVLRCNLHAGALDSRIKKNKRFALQAHYYFRKLSAKDKLQEEVVAEGDTIDKMEGDIAVVKGM